MGAWGWGSLSFWKWGRLGSFGKTLGCLFAIDMLVGDVIDVVVDVVVDDRDIHSTLLPSTSE